MNKEASNGRCAGAVLANADVGTKEEHDGLDNDQVQVEERDGYEVPVPNSDIGSVETDNDSPNVTNWTGYYSTASQTIVTDEANQKEPNEVNATGDELRSTWRTESTLMDTDVLADKLRQADVLIKELVRARDR